MKTFRLYPPSHARRIVGLPAIVCSLILAAASHAQEQPQAETAVPVKVEDQQSFTVIGVSVHTTAQKEVGGNGEIPALWNRVMQDGTFERIPSHADDKILAVYTDYSGDQNSEYTYMVGMRVTSADKVPDGMVSVTVPAGKYAVIESDKGALPDIMPKVKKRIHAMTASELGGARTYKTDYDVFPAGFDWQDTQVEGHVGIK
jgi:predicted transcriptional regulator YdeE